MIFINEAIVTWLVTTDKANELSRAACLMYFPYKNMPAVYDKETHFMQYSLRKKCPYSELFWSVFSRIRTEFGEILRISPYSVQMRENADQNNFE